MPIGERFRHDVPQSQLSSTQLMLRRLPPPRSLDRDQSLPHLPQRGSSWRVTAARVSRTIGKIVTRSPIYTGVGFPNLLFAALSWVIAELLAGFAAYGHALYGTPMSLDDGSRSQDLEPAPAFKPSLILVSEGTREQVQRCDRGRQP